MPMEAGQRVQDVLFDEEAFIALRQLADTNPNLSEVIDDLGRRILDLPGVGLREQTGEQQRTYDLAFVRPRTPRIRRSRQKAFVGFIAPTHQGDWTPPHQRRLSVGIKFNPDSPIRDPQGFLQQRRFAQQGGGGWHDGYVNEDEATTDIAFDMIDQAYHSFE